MDNGEGVKTLMVFSIHKLIAVCEGVAENWDKFSA